ncbi:hypothetical protein [Streptomyces sp. M41(2017)]|uniref:hypothetical protein n=1 Tax=Streptomyces sp. M41(2017) TaxID=1955065 RepID=UPI0011801A79|nr:hypothetical protein [Streptomyces sp. M41(2017)]
MSDDSKTAASKARIPQALHVHIRKLRRRLLRWQLHRQLARGVAYGVGSGAVSLLCVWMESRFLG